MTLRFIFTAVFLFSVLQSSAQLHKRNYHIYDPTVFIDLPVTEDGKKDYLTNQHIDSLEITAYFFKKSGKQNANYNLTKFDINVNGQVVGIVRFEKDKLYNHSLYAYNVDGEITRHVLYNKKGEIDGSAYQNFDVHQLDYYVVKKGDTTLRVIRGKKDEKLQSRDYYYRKGKLKYSWLNEYSADNKVEQVTMFKGNGKVKYVWDYRCKEEGVEINKHKDTTTMCTSITEEDDGTTTYVYQKVNDKGELYKYINRLNKAEELVQYRRLKGVEEKLEFEMDYEYADDDSSVVSTFTKSYRKGKLYRVSDQNYDIDGFFISNTITFFKKDEIKSAFTTRFEYNEGGLPFKYVSENKRNKYKRVEEYRIVTTNTSSL
jgi:hypothetical protein